MDVFEAIQSRRTVRSFNKSPVEFDKVSMIIEAGTSAPSSGNLQNWKFIVVTNKEIIKDLHNYCVDQVWMSEAPVLIVVCGLHEEASERFGDRGKNLYTTQSTAACIQNMLLAANALELGAAWIGAFEEDKIKDIFDIPDNVSPQAIIALGYSDYEPLEKVMQPLEDKVYFNKYGSSFKHLNRMLKDYAEDLKNIGAEVSKQATTAGDYATKFLKEKFEKFRENVKYLLDLK
jgi:nitroreductase